MNDKEFEKLIHKTKEAQKTYLTLLRKTEKEYERRFDNSPVNDDNWIDTMHYPQGEPDFNEIIKKAKEIKSLNK